MRSGNVTVRLTQRPDRRVEVAFSAGVRMRLKRPRSNRRNE
jgi:hypothetical protein